MASERAPLMLGRRFERAVVGEGNGASSRALSVREPKQKPIVLIDDQGQSIGAALCQAAS